MEKDGRMLIATIIYRALLDSILRRAESKYYTHGVRYLKKFDKLSETISDWRGVAPHVAYLTALRRDHGRKSAFWGKYDK
jgi:3-methyladenine DNA glycosylase/8-oxoguanine DNA glycosylase